MFPAVMALVAAVLWIRPRGFSTCWLAGIIFVTSAPEAAPNLLGEL